MQLSLCQVHNDEVEFLPLFLSKWPKLLTKHNCIELKGVGYCFCLKKKDTSKHILLYIFYLFPKKTSYFLCKIVSFKKYVRIINFKRVEILKAQFNNAKLIFCIRAIIIMAAC